MIQLGLQTVRCIARTLWLHCSSHTSIESCGFCFRVNITDPTRILV